MRGSHFDATMAPPSSWLVRAAQHHGVTIPLYRAYGPRSGTDSLDELAAVTRSQRAAALRITLASVDVSELAC